MKKTPPATPAGGESSSRKRQRSLGDDSDEIRNTRVVRIKPGDYKTAEEFQAEVARLTGHDANVNVETSSPLPEDTDISTPSSPAVSNESNPNDITGFSQSSLPRPSFSNSPAADHIRHPNPSSFPRPGFSNLPALPRYEQYPNQYSSSSLGFSSSPVLYQDPLPCNNIPVSPIPTLPHFPDLSSYQVPQVPIQRLNQFPYPRPSFSYLPAYQNPPVSLPRLNQSSIPDAPHFSFLSAYQDSPPLQHSNQSSFPNPHQNQSSIPDAPRFSFLSAYQSSFRNPHQNQSSFRNQHQNQSSLPNPHQNQSSFRNPHQNQSSLPNPHQYQSSFRNPHQNQSSFQNPHQNQSSFPSVHQNQSSFSSPHVSYLPAYQDPLPLLHSNQSSFPCPHQDQLPLSHSNQSSFLGPDFSNLTAYQDPPPLLHSSQSSFPSLCSQLPNPDSLAQSITSPNPTAKSNVPDPTNQTSFPGSSSQPSYYIVFMYLLMPSTPHQIPSYKQQRINVCISVRNITFAMTSTVLGSKDGNVFLLKEKAQNPDNEKSRQNGEWYIYPYTN